MEKSREEANWGRNWSAAFYLDVKTSSYTHQVINVALRREISPGDISTLVRMGFYKNIAFSLKEMYTFLRLVTEYKQYILPCRFVRNNAP